MRLQGTLSKNRCMQFCVAVVFSLAAMTGAAQSSVQLNENCIVSVLNRNVNVNTDGSWVLPNVPAGFGMVRARATCVNAGATTSGQSDPFVLNANDTVNLPHIPLGNTTPIPTTLTITSPSTSLSSVGGTAQLTVRATYASAAAADVTATTRRSTSRAPGSQRASSSRWCATTWPITRA